MPNHSLENNLIQMNIHLNNRTKLLIMFLLWQNLIFTSNLESKYRLLNVQKFCLNRRHRGGRKFFTGKCSRSCGIMKRKKKEKKEKYEAKLKSRVVWIRYLSFENWHDRGGSDDSEKESEITSGIQSSFMELKARVRLHRSSVVNWISLLAVQAHWQKQCCITATS